MIGPPIYVEEVNLKTSYRSHFLQIYWVYSTFWAEKSTNWYYFLQIDIFYKEYFRVWHFRIRLMISFELQHPDPSGKIKIGLLNEVFSLMTREHLKLFLKCSGLIVPNIRNNNFKIFRPVSWGKFPFKIERVFASYWINFWQHCNGWRQRCKSGTQQTTLTRLLRIEAVRPCAS